MSYLWKRTFIADFDQLFNLTLDANAIANTFIYSVQGNVSPVRIWNNLKVMSYKASGLDIWCLLQYRNFFSSVLIFNGPLEYLLYTRLQNGQIFYFVSSVIPGSSIHILCLFKLVCMIDYFLYFSLISNNSNIKCSTSGNISNVEAAILPKSSESGTGRFAVL
jgi:hypothetical protein